MLKKIFLSTIVFIFIFSCEENSTGSIVELPDVITNSVTEITTTSAKCGGKILDDGGAEITDRGVCWCRDEFPTINDKTTCDGCGTGSFISTITDLISETDYYVRAYAKNDAGTNYGDVIEFTTLGSVTDIDGNTYKTVKIGDQWWMAENLKVTHYKNGNPIPEIKDNNEWINRQFGAYCYYSNVQFTGTCYGKLYNWYAVTDDRGIAPEGWHVPSKEDWKKLEFFLGLSPSEVEDFMWRGTNEGDRLKATAGWNNNGNGTDDYGFHALPGGYRWYEHGEFLDYGKTAAFWSTTEYDKNNRNGINRALQYNKSEIGRAYNPKTCGMSVRCVKD